MFLIIEQSITVLVIYLQSGRKWKEKALRKIILMKILKHKRYNVCLFIYGLKLTVFMMIIWKRDELSVLAILLFLFIIRIISR